MPLAVFRRFTALRDDLAAELGLPDLTNGDMFLAVFKHAEQDPDGVREVLRRIPKSSKG